MGFARPAVAQRDHVLPPLDVLAAGEFQHQHLVQRRECGEAEAVLSLHTVGAHYTYAEVPYDAWSEALLGMKLNDVLGLERNHFDRLVHFSYGLLMAYPMRELFLRVADARGFWGYFLPLDLTLSTSAIFELFEWVAAELFGGDLGIAYLGSQGGMWDAQKDMALAGLGAAIAMTVTLLVNRRLQRDFNREWDESLQVKRRLPLGEVELARRASA